MAISNVTQHIDPLSIVNKTFSKFTKLLGTVRGHNETLKNFETRFDAAASGYNSTAPSAKLTESLVAFILVGNAKLNDGQRV